MKELFWTCLLVLVGLALGLTKSLSNPHIHNNINDWLAKGKPFRSGRYYTAPSLSSSSSLQGSDYPTLSASPSVVDSSTEYVTVSWYNVTYQSAYDYIALFNNSNDPMLLDGPPIKFKYLSSSGKYPPTSGSIKFKLLNRRTEYIFAYITESDGYREIQGVSNVVSYENLYEPMNVHIALVNPINNNEIKDDFAIQIMWNQKEWLNPSIKYGTSINSLTSILSYNNGENGYITTYNSSMLCDGKYGQPASLGGWFEPGNFINLLLQGLLSSTTYYYQVGESTYGWTNIYNFTTPCSSGNYNTRDDNSIKFIGFGDLGNMAIDFSKHHSWDWNNEGELYSINTTNTIYNEYIDGPKDYSDFLMHTGDISYAVGYISEWDDFLNQIGNIANHIYYMTGIGNHEYAWSGEWMPPQNGINGVSSDSYGSADSGGECGIPYNSIFPFASINPTSNPGPLTRLPWYTYDYGVVRVIVMSTEHDFSQGSQQYNYFENILSNTDRNIFPWIFFTGHRPMYVDSTFDGDSTLSKYMVSQLEPLFQKYKISVGMWGHAHQYGRTCPVYSFQCQSDGTAPIHIVYGMAGYELSSSSASLSYFVKSDHTHYGFIHFTVLNSTHCYTKFINSADGSILDSFYIINQYSN